MDDDEEAGNDGQRSSRQKRSRAGSARSAGPTGSDQRAAMEIRPDSRSVPTIGRSSSRGTAMWRTTSRRLSQKLSTANSNGTRKQYPEVPVKTWAEFSRYVSTAVVNRLRDTAASESARSTRQSDYATHMTPDMLDTQTPRPGARANGAAEGARRGDRQSQAAGPRLRDLRQRIGHVVFGDGREVREEARDSRAGDRPSLREVAAAVDRSSVVRRLGPSWGLGQHRGGSMTAQPYDRTTTTATTISPGSIATFA